jgi:hypothetical protein
VGVTKTLVLDTSDTTSSHTHSAISDSVVFFDDDGQLDDVIDAITNQDYDFDDYDDYDEIDKLYPYNNEDDNEVNHHHRRISISKVVVSTNDLHLGMSSNNPPTQLSDRESMSASSTEGTLAQMILGLEKRLEMSTNSSDDHGGNLSEDNNGSDENKRESIVGGRTLLQMSFEEKRNSLLHIDERRVYLLILEELMDLTNRLLLLKGTTPSYHRWIGHLLPSHANLPRMPSVIMPRDRMS